MRYAARGKNNFLSITNKSEAVRLYCVMRNGILQLDEKLADDFWRLRIELFEELGEISKDMNISELKSATKQYYLSHINKDLISWGAFQNEKIVAIGSFNN